MNTKIKTRNALAVVAFVLVTTMVSYALAGDRNSETSWIGNSSGWVSVDGSESRKDSNNEFRESERDPFMRDERGVQRYFPGVVKIVGRSEMKRNEQGAQTVPFFYGSGTYVCEYGRWGIVVTNWHVVNESTDTIDVVFPSGRYRGRVILRDEKWDLAALLIHAPNNVDPVPISDEGPAIGETFWVGGYGPSADLAEFELRPGKLTNYVSLVDPDDEIAKELAMLEEDDVEDGADPYKLREAKSRILTDEEAERLARKNPTALYETLQISQGVRRGDSGGPIFNRYGELAGILWGSDGKCTMGTSCIRLRVFLTQAVNEAAAINAESRLDNIPGYDLVMSQRRLPSDCSLARRTHEYAKAALEQEGVFPICTREVYASVNGERAESFLRLSERDAIRVAQRNAIEYQRKNGLRLPPSPAIYSPTFVVLQRAMKRAHPEKLDENGFAELDSYAEKAALRKRERRAAMEQRPLLAAADDGATLSFAPGARAASEQESLRPAAFPQGVGSAQPRLLPAGSATAREGYAEQVDPAPEGFNALDEHDRANNLVQPREPARSTTTNASPDPVPADKTPKADETKEEAAEAPDLESQEQNNDTENPSDDPKIENADAEVGPVNPAQDESAGPPETRMGPLSVYFIGILFFVIFFFAMRYFENGFEKPAKKKSDKVRLHSPK